MFIEAMRPVPQRLPIHAVNPGRRRPIHPIVDRSQRQQPPRLIRVLRLPGQTAKMRVLENDHAVLERGGGRLVLAGVTDLSASHSPHLAPDLAAALKGAPKDAAVILLDHQPREARRAAALGVAVQLSGHTNGGMVLGLDRLAARANSGYVSGRYQVERMTLYVNNGIGLWPGFALRLGRPSELTRITLRQAT
jgi:uncharacterized protein